MIINPKSPFISVHLEQIQDPTVREALRGLLRSVEQMYTGIARVANHNLAQSVQSSVLPDLAEGESLVWVDNNAGEGAPAAYLIVKMGGQVYKFPSIETSDQIPVEDPPPPPDEEPPPEPEPDPGPLPPEQGRAVPTFHCMGLYWQPPSDPGSAGATLEYKKTVDAVWLMAHPMWYDSRNGECRGSVFWLDPGTEYQFRFSMPGGSPIGSVTASTWSEIFPEGEVVSLPQGVSNQTLVITAGGLPNAYKVYQPASGATHAIDVENARDFCVEVRAPYVIVRGLTLKSARMDLVRLSQGSHHVVVEKNDMSDWGRPDTTHNVSGATGWPVGETYDSCVRINQVVGCKGVVIQYNYMHDPRYGSNPWDVEHPHGPHAITVSNKTGNTGQNGDNQNMVIRWNTIIGDSSNPANNKKWFNDAIGGGRNDAFFGCPGPDTDIYGNKVVGVMDDGMEMEGSGRNVRVWGNYLDYCSASMFASQPCLEGPLYFMRNVMNQSRMDWLAGTSWDGTRTGRAHKASDRGAAGKGQRLVFHNTMLQAPPAPGDSSTRGLDKGMRGDPLTNTKSRNNIYHTRGSGDAAISTGGGTGNSANYDLYNGTLSGISEANGIRAVPTYAVGHGQGDGGNYALATGTSGFDDGEVLDNINSLSFMGVGPDRGAHESGTPALVFGHLGSGKGAGQPI